MRVPEERRSVPAAFLASFTTNFSDSKCQMAVAVLHRCQNTSIHRRDAEYERERVQRAPHTPIAVRPRFSSAAMSAFAGHGSISGGARAMFISPTPLGRSPTALSECDASRRISAFRRLSRLHAFSSPAGSADPPSDLSSVCGLSPQRVSLSCQSFRNRGAVSRRDFCQRALPARVFFVLGAALHRALLLESTLFIQFG